MLIKTEKEGVFAALSSDMICIMKLPGGTFHAAFIEEWPMPGPVVPVSELPILRMKSKFHQTVGVPTLEKAKEEVKKLREKFIIPDISVYVDEAIEVADPVCSFMIQNWTTDEIALGDALKNSFILVAT